MQYNKIIQIALILCLSLLWDPHSSFAQYGHTELKIQNIMSPVQVTPNPRKQLLLDKQDNVLLASKIIGVAAGSTLGVLNVYWNENNKLNKKLPAWKSVLYTVPVCLVGSYVGYQTSEWAAQQFMDKKLNMGESLFYGVVYGAIDGAAVLSSSLFTAFIIGHYTDTIRFNFQNQSWMPVKILGISLGGGLVYGSLIGGVAGLAAGPTIHLYVQF